MPRTGQNLPENNGKSRAPEERERRACRSAGDAGGDGSMSAPALMRLRRAIFVFAPPPTRTSGHFVSGRKTLCFSENSVFILRGVSSIPR